jgi:hypothetical protein
MWQIVHTEELRADRTLTIFHKDSGYGDHNTLFETNVEGLYISYYGGARDAITAENRITQICYGWDVLMSEADDKVRDAFFWSALEGRLGDDGCAHSPYTCDQVHHAAQVLLGNDECEGCEVCEWSETIHIPDAYLP